MQIIQPSVTLDYVTPNSLKVIEEAARICYASEKIGDNNNLLYKIILNGHHSVLEHAIASFTVICDRGVTHEAVRHRLASFSQESTRYCNYGEDKKGISFVTPEGFELTEDDLDFLQMVEDHYNRRLNEGLTPQDARYFLPNGLRTKIKITMNFRELRHFFNLRYFGVTGKPHPDMKVIAKKMFELITEQVPIIFTIDAPE